MARPKQPTKGALPADGRAQTLAGELAHRLLGSVAQSSLGRRRYLLALTAEPYYIELAAHLEAFESAGPNEASPELERLLLLRSRRDGFRAVGSARLGEGRRERGLVIEISGLSVPDDPW